jgi:hypothetical protein
LLVADFLATYPELDAQREEYDLAYVNVWCPYHCQVEQKPLAVLDAQTLEKQDVVATTYTGITELNNRLQYARDRRDNKIQMLSVNPRHRWVYFPQMQTNEAIMFKQMDTRAGHSKFCFHTAFDHPDTKPAARERRSVEFRVMLAIRKQRGEEPSKEPPTRPSSRL